MNTLALAFLAVSGFASGLAVLGGVVIMIVAFCAYTLLEVDGFFCFLFLLAGFALAAMGLGGENAIGYIFK
jgi:hypothetical protein